LREAAERVDAELREDDELRVADLDLAADFDPDLLPPPLCAITPPLEPSDGRDYFTNAAVMSR
jgi:hypothetical protein